MEEWLLTELLECSVCLESLDSTSRVLPCQHTFCLRCLTNIARARGVLRCPECRLEAPLPVEDLPCNILLNRLLEGLKHCAPASSSSSKAVVAKPEGPPHSQNGPPPPPPLLTPPPAGLEKRPKNPHSQIPCAIALCSHEAQEPGHLSFRKGDQIILRGRAGPSWYQGKLGGKGGLVQASMVQVQSPLGPPLCQALYDFSPSDTTKDCLHFSKGDRIHVIRQVDENWAEGKFNDKIGIFPISFVEMNPSAKALMKSSSIQARPVSGGGNPVIYFVPPKPGERVEPMRPGPTFRPSEGGDLSSTSSSASPTSPPPARPQNKRHSAPPTAHHSVEILTSATSDNLEPPPPGELPWDRRKHPASPPSVEPAPVYESAQQTNVYVALYAYKPDKEDELELRKGELYVVTEKCQDGWFKGSSLRTSKTGVFPGNYVQCARLSSSPHYSPGVVGNGVRPVEPKPASPGPQFSGERAGPLRDWSPSQQPQPSSSANPWIINPGWQQASESPSPASGLPHSPPPDKQPLPPQPVVKEKKDRICLMKRFKQSITSPPAAIQQAPVLNVVHVRSGSCPSEALSGNPVHKKSLSIDGSSGIQEQRPRPVPIVRERFRCIVPYPPNSDYELELKVGDIVYVLKKRDDGWFKGTLQRTGKTGLFPASFVESF